MELLLLDSSFDELGRVDDFESLQWTSRYYDVSDYKLILGISAFDLFMSAVYLYRPDSGQLAWVEDVLYKVSDSGKQQLQITGRLIESALDDRVIDTESIIREPQLRSPVRSSKSILWIRQTGNSQVFRSARFQHWLKVYRGSTRVIELGRLVMKSLREAELSDESV